MNGIEKITGRILDDAQQEADRILAEAEAEANTIRTQYEAQAARERDEILRRGTERAQEREGNLAGAAQLEARKDILAAKQVVLDKAFTLAEQQLRAIKGDEYVSLLANLATQASVSGAEQIVLSAEDKERYGDQILAASNEKLAAAKKTAKLTLAEGARPTGGGLLLSDGKVETNCTFESLLRLTRSDVSGEVASVLFP